MSVPLIVVDAFTDKPFHGNPAAVCLLTEPRDVDWMQAVAGEMNLSETAFVWPIAGGYSLRWFTPTIEVDLCGHATLAAAHAMWSEGIAAIGQSIRFQTNSGRLLARWQDNWIELDFPSTPAVACDRCQELIDELQVEPLFFGKTPFDRFIVVESAAIVRSLQPNFERLASIGPRGVIVTSPSDSPEFDFVSRFFAPAAGINEDPVTGSAHCALAPYWSSVLGKNSMTGYQASKRGGVVRVRTEGARVLLNGQAVTVLRGQSNA